MRAHIYVYVWRVCVGAHACGHVHSVLQILNSQGVKAHPLTTISGGQPDPLHHVLGGQSDPLPRRLGG